MKLLILGAGGHGCVCGEIAKECGYDKILYLDDNILNAKSVGVVGCLSDYDRMKEQYEIAFVAIGNPDIRECWVKKLKSAGYGLATLVSKKAMVSTSASVAEGSVVMAGAVVQSNVEIGMGSIISAGAIVDHNAVVGQYCHVNAGAIVPSMTIVPERLKINYGQIYVGN